MKSRNKTPNYSLFVLLSGFFSACVTCSIKLTDGTLELGQILFVRYFPLAVLSLACLLIKGIGLKTSCPAYSSARSISGILAVVFFTLAAQKIPVATAQALFYCSPLFTAILFCWVSIRKGDPVALRILPLIPICLGGVFLINKPHLISSELPYISLGFASAFFLSCASLSLKKLGALKESPLRTIFYFASACTLTGIIINAIQKTDLLAGFFSPISWALFLFTLLQQLTATLGWGRGSTLLNCVFQFVGVPCAIFIGLVIFEESLSSSELTGITILVTTEASALWMMRERKD